MLVSREIKAYSAAAAAELQRSPALWDAMTEKLETPGSPPPRLSDWNRVADRMAPNLLLWMLAGGIAAGVMLYLSPIDGPNQVLTSIGAVLLAPVVLCVAWFTGVSGFAVSCETFRRGANPAPLHYIVPILLAAIVGLGLLGGGYWWLLSFALAVQGYRKGTQRAWWNAVACVAYVFREGIASITVASTDEEALTKAMDAINKEIGRG